MDQLPLEILQYIFDLLDLRSQVKFKHATEETINLFF